MPVEVCACLLVKYVDFFTISCNFTSSFGGEGWVCLGLSLRTGGGDLFTGGDSAGEVFSEYTPLGAFNLVNSLIFSSAREVHTLFALAEVLVMLANNWSLPPFCLLALEATEPAEEAIKRSITSYKLNN